MYLGKTLREFESLGCPDPKKTAIAARVYIDLLKNNHLNDVEKTYDTELKEIYMRGLRLGDLYHVIPVRSTEQIKLAEMNTIRSRFADMGKLILAVYNSCGKVMYFDLQDGISEMRFERTN
ncbi:uncharacterized protein LOC119683629 [Teleopsis dalmanni]|uniref:uncharacterized protein LOC119683629 n=1 Tax=Teleopsis dalmanni TaxID=139649 RepID=UPI0018CFB382|nr:uncharacterized protein LOC119683629 [Teleopsis dalmanni]